MAVTGIWVSSMPWRMRDVPATAVALVLDVLSGARKNSGRLPWDWSVGRCSGFRPCCILWFTFVWSVARGGVQASYWTDGMTGVRLDLANQYISRLIGWGYVPCPACLITGSRIVARRCTETCGHRPGRLREERWGL